MTEARRWRRQTAEPDDSDIHLRLINWARAYRTRYGHTGGPSGAAPNELDAEQIEAALVALKAARSRLYDVLWQVYMARRDDVTGAQACRIPIGLYKGRLRAAYGWLDGWLSGAWRRDA